MGMHSAAACAIALSLHLQPGAHIVEHSAYDDRIAWVLPPDRLAAFRRAGVVIDEDKRTRIVALATVSDDPRDMFTLKGTVNTTMEDVPRHRATHSIENFTDTVTPRNDPLPARIVDLEDAAMVGLPGRPLCVGESWRTRVLVLSSLGSGEVTIDHTLVDVTDRLIQIDVHGIGIISGVEYNLPRLLPGAMAIEGTAWFDPQRGMITQESYLVHNRLIRTVHGKTIGFLETETVDETTGTTVSSPAPKAQRTSP